MTLRLTLLWAGFALLPGTAHASELLPNGGFENGLDEWHGFWSRDPGSGSATPDTQVVHGGTTAVRIEHRGNQDWSLNASASIPVEGGDMFSLEGWVRAGGPGTVTLCVQLHDPAGKVVDWAFGGRTVEGARDWTKLRRIFVIPAGVARMEPRLIGYGPGTCWLDDVSLRKAESARRPALSAGTEGAPPGLTNTLLRLQVDETNGAIDVRDARTGTVWKQRPLLSEVILRQVERIAGEGLRLRLWYVPSDLELTASIRLEPDAPEFTVTLDGAGELTDPLPFPHPFAAGPGTYVVVPMNEGISFPVDDLSIEPMRLIAYGGHGICMAFWGVTDGQAGHMGILETADDASVRIDRRDGRLLVAPEWDPLKGGFGAPRRLRYVFFDRGGHVAMAKRYRAYAQSIGRLKTLREKRAANPDVDLLIGAVNVWCWDNNGPAVAREMQAAGIDRLLWSNRQSPENLRTLNELKVLTSRYDIYQDVMDPGNFKFLSGVHPDWTTAAWPDDILRKADGDWVRGWAVKGTNSQWYPCGVICDLQAPRYATQRIPAELQTHPYRCRFIDTTTAAPWNECYAPNHPMSRGESRVAKMRLLDYVSRDLGLVTGCETGHDAAVPYLHYFEGMLSLGPYRIPDAGRDMARIWDEVPERVAKFQLGHRYRLPLWELVYHDCVVAQWYWGDYNNKLPALWDRRDLFNALYGTPPMFMFNRDLWRTNKDRFVRSYRATAPIARATGYSEMTDHRFLTPDRSVQQTTFANGTTVTVNFGDAAYRMSDHREIPALGSRVQGPPE